MRAKFTVKLVAGPDRSYSTDEEVRKGIRTLGWESREVSRLDPSDWETAYKREAAELFNDMPEVAQAEKDDYGYLGSDQTPFVVTRPNESEIIYRLLQPELPKLIQATEKVIRAIEAQMRGASDDIIVNKSVLIYERNSIHVITEGRVIEKKALEALKTNVKDAVVVLLSVIALLFIATVGVINFLTGHSPILPESIERIIISIVVVLTVAAVGLYITYNQIRNFKIISWDLKRAS